MRALSTSRMNQFWLIKAFPFFILGWMRHEMQTGYIVYEIFSLIPFSITSVHWVRLNINWDISKGLGSLKSNKNFFENINIEFVSESVEYMTLIWLCDKKKFSDTTICESVKNNLMKIIKKRDVLFGLIFGTLYIDQL